MSAKTFEAGSAGLTELGGYQSLREASGALPNGAYTTFRTYEHRRVVRLRQHVARLQETAALKGLAGGLGLEPVRAAVSAVLDATGFTETRFRMTFVPPRLFLSVEPFSPLPMHLYDEGASCVTVSLHRENPHAKDTQFIATASAAYRGLPAGVEEGLMLAEDGSVLEGLSSNFFAVENGRLWTEEGRVLQGVTRSLVLEVAGSVLPVELTAPRLEPGMDECFITSVSREVLPVIAIDGRRIGAGRPGPVTREIARRFAALVAQEAEEV